MRLTISDDLADRYLALLPTNAAHSQRKDEAPPYSLELLITRVLERAVPLTHPGALVLSAEQTEALVDALLLPDGAREPHRIVDAAKELADMKIGKFRLKLPAPVIRGLQDRADREGKSLSLYVQQIVDKITEEVAHYA
jgi:hypothetical protein